MKAYTSAHWGIREVFDAGGGELRLENFAGDPDPTPIGLDQHGDRVEGVRVRRPSVRRSWLEKGPGASPELRGRDPFVEVEWDEALDLVAAELQRVRDVHGNEAIFGGSYGWSSAGRFHHAQSQVHRFLNSIGGYVRHLNSYSLGAARVMMSRIIAPMESLMANHTSWDVMAQNTRLFVAFGGVPWKNAQISAGGIARHRVRPGLKALREAGIRIVNIGPVGDNLEADGVEWIRLRPNTDTALMLAIAWTLVDEGLADRAFLERYCVGFDRFEAYVMGRSDGQPRDPQWAESITGVPAATIAALARDMAATRTMVNMAWSLQRASHGEQPCWMLVTLAAMLGQIGLPGGGFGFGYGATNSLGSDERLLSGPTLPQGANPVSAFIPVARIADMLLQPGGSFAYDGGVHTYPDIRMVYWAGGNPYHHHQDLNRLVKAWEKPETIVVHEQYWTATAKRADIVLPATISMERDDIGYSTREGHLVAMKRVKAPLAEARDDYDIFADLAGRLGAPGYTEGLTSREWLQRLYEESRGKMAGHGVSLPDFETFWKTDLIDLGEHSRPVVMLEEFRNDPAANPLATPSGRIEIFSETIEGFGLDDCPGHAAWLEPHEWLGQVQPGDTRLHLISDQPQRRLHSQLDAASHSLEGKVAGREPVYLNPQDAAARGIADGDIVELSNERGRCLAGVILSEDIMPGVARLATGAWYDPDPDTGLEKHGNPNVLTLDVGTSSFAQGSVAQTCLVEVSGPVRDAPQVTAFDPPPFVVRGS
ncbi:molybdopterin guanine dinucleotide-containing S/N-oxide reductase [Arvimicrobium flavum]|uniref:molybdopterin guanine dinucleotide-containing S/N-oxide reductase n=1 Tax=Arvimicrobium flavum TaxID=3393320 RepID=UPI00237BC91A|nr:molybdopterin guanine dinucleotide-containing S/N-oxide reductase [Mesorhizobium shangrilense]